MKKLVGLILAALLLTGADDPDTPDGGLYGLHMGMQRDQLDIMSYFGASIYSLKTVPQPYPRIFGYNIRFHATTGLCLVSGRTNAMEALGPGAALRREFHAMREVIEETYGPARVADYVFGGSTQLWAAHFMRKLASNEAVLAARWNYDNDNRLGDEIKLLSLFAQAVNSTTAVLILEARFNNYTECMQIIMREERERDERLDIPE